MKTSAVGDVPGQGSPQRRLKIAVLNRIFVPTGGGAERYSIALVEQLAARHEIHVFAQEIGHVWPGVHYHQIPRWFKKPRWLNQLWYAYATRRATKNEFDIVHSHENVWHGNVHTMHVKTVQRSLFEGLNGLSLALRRLKVALSPRLLAYLSFERARLAGRKNLAVIAASQPLQDELIVQYPHTARVISTITPGVAVPVKPPSKQIARQALGVPLEGKVIAFIANDYARKGLPTLLAAMQDIPTAQLLVAGHSGQTERFKALALSLGVADQVVFLGPQSDLGLLYCAADVLAHPTLEDTFAMVVLEAMAHGLPVALSSSKYCGIASLLTHGANALILDNPLDKLALSAALNGVLGNEVQTQILSQAGIAFALQHSWAAAALAYEAVYFNVLN